MDSNDSDIMHDSSYVLYRQNDTNSYTFKFASEIMFGTGLFGNLLAFIVLLRSQTGQKKSIFYRLVAGLTVTDLVGTTLTSPVVIAVKLNNFKWVGGQPLCDYFGYVMILAGYATMLIICSMSIERVICVRYPYFYHTRLCRKYAIIILIFCWTLAAFIASFPLMGLGKIVLLYPYTWCFFDLYSTNTANKAFNYFYALFGMLIICITVLCNLTVMCTLFNNCRNDSILPESKEKSRTCNRFKRYRDCQMLVQLVGITLVFSTCYLPLMVKVFLDQNELLPRDIASYFPFIRMASVNQILDPWIYILLRRELLWKIIAPFRNYDNRRNQLNAMEIKSKENKENHSCFNFCSHCLCDPSVEIKQVSRKMDGQGRSVVSHISPDIHVHSTITTQIDKVGTQRDSEELLAYT